MRTLIELVKAVQAGDNKAEAELAIQLYPRVRKLLSKYRVYYFFEDVVQECIMWILREVVHFNTERSWDPWFCRVVKHSACTLYRKYANTRSTSLPMTDDDYDHLDIVHHSVMPADRAYAIREVVCKQELTPLEEAIVNTYYAGSMYGEVSRLAESHGVTERQFFSARAKLDEKLRAAFADFDE